MAQRHQPALHPMGAQQQYPGMQPGIGQQPQRPSSIGTPQAGSAAAPELAIKYAEFWRALRDRQLIHPAAPIPGDASIA